MKVKFFIRLGISAAILWTVLRFVDFDRLIELFWNLNYSYLAGAFVLTVVIRMMMTLRWHMLLRSQGVTISWTRLLQIIMMTHSIGVLIPSSLGMDGLKALALSKETGKSADAISSVIVDRISGLVALASIAFPVSFFVFQRDGNLTYLIISGSAFFACLFSIVAVIALEEKIHRLCIDFRKGREGVFLKKVKSLITSFALIGRDKHCLLIVFAYSIVVQSFRILLVFFFASALDIQIRFEYFAIFVPFIMLLLMLPISISGIGVQEVAYFHFFGHLGMSIEQAVGLAFFFYIEDILWVLLGLCAYWYHGMDKGFSMLGGKKIADNDGLNKIKA